MVPKGGLEPPRVSSHGPQPCASTSSATSAKLFLLAKTLTYFLVAAGEALAFAGVALLLAASLAAGEATTTGFAGATGAGAGVAAGLA